MPETNNSQIFREKLTSVINIVDVLQHNINLICTKQEIRSKEIGLLKNKINNHLDLQESIGKINNKLSSVDENLKTRGKEIGLLKSKINDHQNLYKSIAEVKDSLKLIDDRLDIKEKEINLLQIKVGTPTKWWAKPSNIISIFAIFFSIFATSYTIQNEQKKGVSSKKLRAKEIVKRLTEISGFYVDAGPQLGAILQNTFQEVSNLVDEAIDLSKENINYLNDSEYATIIGMAYNVNKTKNFEELTAIALSVTNDTATEYAILNHRAQYFFEVKNQPEIGRKIIQQVIQKTKAHLVSEKMKKINLANEYTIWSGLEFTIDNFNRADSLLLIAENLINNDSYKFHGHPIVDRIKSARIFLDETVNGLKSNQ